MSYAYSGNQNPETGDCDPLTAGVQVCAMPLAESGTNNTVVCQTCHLPHGSSAAMSGFADPTGAWAAGTTDALDSSLLRMDSRGVCQACHQK
jgi:hypothetical protein